MAQQEMDYGEFKHGTPGTGYAGYQGISPDDDKNSSSMYGQKLSDHVSFRGPTISQRFTLALVSLVMLMVMTLSLILLVIVTHGDGNLAAAVVFALGFFYIAVIIINALFNRKH
jgi:hypothetical protein